LNEVIRASISKCCGFKTDVALKKLVVMTDGLCLHSKEEIEYVDSYVNKLNYFGLSIIILLMGST
jgi:hypothetical protein